MCPPPPPPPPPPPAPRGLGERHSPVPVPTSRCAEVRKGNFGAKAPPGAGDARSRRRFPSGVCVVQSDKEASEGSEADVCPAEGPHPCPGLLEGGEREEKPRREQQRLALRVGRSLGKPRGGGRAPLARTPGGSPRSGCHSSAFALGVTAPKVRDVRRGEGWRAAAPRHPRHEGSPKAELPKAQRCPPPLPHHSV